MSKKFAGADLSSLTIDTSVAETASLKLAPKTSPITREIALTVGKEFAERVRKELDAEALIFVFGSTVKNTASLESDIDIAVISDLYGDDVMQGCILLGEIAYAVSWDIEVHTVAQTDWKKDNTLHVSEIKHWGVAV